MFGLFIAAATICGLSVLLQIIEGGARNLVGAVVNSGITYLLVWAALHT